MKNDPSPQFPAGNIKPEEVLFIETPFTSKSGTEETKAYVQSKYNLALLALGSFVRTKSQYRVRLINMVKDRLDDDAVLLDIRMKTPRVIGIPLYSYNLGQTYRLIKKIKSQFPQIHICVGGPHVGIYPKETIELPAIDSIVLGDGEVPFLEICRQVIEEGAPHPQKLPPGVFTKNSILPGCTFTPHVHENLNDLPMPDLTLLGDYKRYRDFLSNDIMGILTTSRGCPFVCHYCRSEVSDYRPFSIEHTIACMRHYRDMGVEYIEFWDETFNPNKKRLEDFADALLEAQLGITWAIRGAVVLHVVPQTLKKLKKTGLRVMQFGVESGNERILKYLNKKQDFQKISQAIETCRQTGIRCVANMIINIPTQTRAEIQGDLNMLKGLQPTYLSVSIYNWAPGTTHYANALSQTVIEHDFWREHAKNPQEPDPTVHAVTETPIEEVYLMRDRFVRWYYLNASYVLRYLTMAQPKEIIRAFFIAWLMIKSLLKDRSVKIKATFQ